MNKIIKEQLDRIRANIEYDDNTTEIFISRDKPVVVPGIVGLQEGHTYNIFVEDYILHEPPNFTLSSNWNKGIVPKSKYMCACVIRLNGKMVQVDARGYNPDTGESNKDCYYNFWLPSKAIHIVEEV